MVDTPLSQNVRCENKPGQFEVQDTATSQNDLALSGSSVFS
jgi:hypothetical protein